MDYIKIDATDAVDAVGVETYQAGEWVAVERVVLDGRGTAAVRYVGGGSSVAPSHFFTFRRSVEEAAS